MSGRFSVWIMWTGNCWDVLRSTETFQLLAPFSSFILEFFCFLKGHSPSLWNWIMGSLAVTGCWFAASHYAINSMTTSNTLLCAMCTSEAIVDMQIALSARYPDNFRLVTCGRSHVEQKKNITSGSIAIKDFHDNLIGSISFHFVQAHCLAWVTAVVVLFPFVPTLENTLLLMLPSPAWLVWVMMSLICMLHSASWAALMADHLIPDFISGYAFRMTSSAESFIIIRRCTFPILNSSTSKDIGSCRFPELVYKSTFEKQGGTPSYLCRCLLLYCWICSMWESTILYICKGHKRRGSRLCW